MAYPRYVVPSFSPFDPLEVAHQTEKIIGKGKEKKYTHFYCTGVYGGISTAYTVGCCLRCIFCWVDWSRDFPESYGEFYSPEKVAAYLLTNARKKGVKKLRISGGEPTLLKEHLLEVLEALHSEPYMFILETNGILMGNDEELVKSLREFSHLYIRISIKAGTPESFEKKTGAKREFFYLPFKALQFLKKHRIPFHVAVMSDPFLMSPKEREELKKYLQKFGYKGYLEEERCDPYPTSLARLRYAEWGWKKEWLKR